MAPEVILHSSISSQADQFALAVMLYELLAARKPFDGLRPSAVLVANASTDPPSLREYAPQLDDRTIDGITRAMSKDPAARFPSCEAFVDSVLAAVPKPKPLARFRLMCPACSKLLTVYSQLAGRPGACPKCGVNLTIGLDLQSLWLREDREGAGGAVGEPTTLMMAEEAEAREGSIRWGDSDSSSGSSSTLHDIFQVFRELGEVVVESTFVKIAILAAVALVVALVLTLGPRRDAQPGSAGDQPLPAPAAAP
jgi:serine/threonine protein kinase